MPQHKRGPWSQTEDQYLLHLVNVHGAHNWVRISSTIQTRSPKQCRERFHQNLKPNLNHDPITPEEGILIEQMVAEMGKRWAEIARRLRGRSDNAVKNWWNGGMNRRRRSNHQRRAEMEVRQQPYVLGQASTVPTQPPTHHHSLPPNYSSHASMPQQHFYGQQMYHSGQLPQSQPVSVPSNAPLYRHHGLVETPLPSPSAFSQMSADGAPSLISDCSSASTRSPHNQASPIELPPLSGSRDERRQSAAPMLRLGVPGTFVNGNEMQAPSMQMKQAPHMLQEPFVPHRQQQAFPQQLHYLPSQYQQRQPSPVQQHAPVHPQYQVPSVPLLRSNHFPRVPQLPSTPSPLVQLPSISNLAVGSSLPIDPALIGAHTPNEGSPKDKMSLSNLTH